MSEELQPFDTAEFLTNPQDLRALISDAFASDDPVAIEGAIRIAAKACRKSFAGEAATLDDLLKIAQSLGLRVTVLPR